MEFHDPRKIAISPLGAFGWGVMWNKHLPLRKGGSTNEAVDAADEQNGEDESGLCAALTIQIPPSKSDLAMIDMRTVKSGPVGGLKAGRERELGGLIKADGCTIREDNDDL